MALKTGDSRGQAPLGFSATTRGTGQRSPSVLGASTTINFKKGKYE